MGASLTCVKWSEPPRSGYNTLFDQNLLCYEKDSLDYYRSATETITQTELCHEIYSNQTMGAIFNFPLKTIKESIIQKEARMVKVEGDWNGLHIVGFKNLFPNSFSKFIFVVCYVSARETRLFDTKPSMFL